MAEGAVPAPGALPASTGPGAPSSAAPPSSAAGCSGWRHPDQLPPPHPPLEAIIERMKEQEEKLKQRLADSQHRERVLMRRLTAKEQEVQDYAAQITELKSAQVGSAGIIGNARTYMLDPAVNVLVVKLKEELVVMRNRLEETQNEFSAWKFTPDSNTGKKLMAKCRLLHQENEDLGKMTTSGRIAKLEGDLALQKSLSEEAKKSQGELDEFLLELEEDVEGLQSTVFFLQQELRVAHERIVNLTKEVTSLRSRDVSDSNHASLTNGAAVDEYDSEPSLILKVSEREKLCDDEDSRESAANRRTHLASENNKCYGLNGTDESKSENRTNCESGLEKKRSYESDSSECSSSGQAKKQRRASVLSLDYLEDEALTTPNGDVN